MRKLVRGFRARGRAAQAVLTTRAEDEGFAAYARGASALDCPYGDDERSAAWSRGYRRADRLDASAW